MGSKSDAYEIDVLKATTGQATTILTTTPFATVYVGLFSVSPTDAAGGTELVGGAYARVDSKGKWGTPAAGSVSNNAVITYPTATADWSSAVAFGLFTAATGGTPYEWGALTVAKTVLNGDTASFGAGTLVLTED